ncbi:MAG: oligosaccharide flippase family protein [Acidimicrobiales bacterium]
MTSHAARSFATAGAWTIGGKLGAKGFDLASFILLAKTLKPADFGVVALALTVVLIVDVVTEMPLSQPLLRAAELSPDHYHTSFTLGVLRAVALALLAAGLGPLISRFTPIHGCLASCWFLAIGPVLRSLTSPRMADFARRYDMRPDSVIVVSKGVSFAVVATVALTAHSYWAIVSASATTALSGALLSHVMAPYRPCLRLTRWREFADVVGWTSASQVLAAINSYSTGSCSADSSLPTCLAAMRWPLTCR